MNARQKKLYLIQQKLRQSRKANQQAVVAEKRREVSSALSVTTSLRPFLSHNISSISAALLQRAHLCRVIRLQAIAGLHSFVMRWQLAGVAPLSALSL